MSWPNKEQLAHYLNVDYKGEFGAYGDDLLEAFEQLDEYDLQQHILALWVIMPLFDDESDWALVSQKERQRVIHSSIQQRKIADNIKSIKKKATTEHKPELTLWQKLLMLLSPPR
ncbi:hypothetical protein PALB_20970 [Pseudoalteromonas luteoviolacea B = ATCC 29581]|nr:hypothetical protein PALB_20970 [Pseudoalteromonas luteoviolacea B = ATCC 29581]